VTILVSATQPESEREPREDKRAWTSPSLRPLPAGNAEGAAGPNDDNNFGNS
jgi:hypothetical protein